MLFLDSTTSFIFFPAVGSPRPSLSYVRASVTLAIEHWIPGARNAFALWNAPRGLDGWLCFVVVLLSVPVGPKTPPADDVERNPDSCDPPGGNRESLRRSPVPSAAVLLLPEHLGELGVRSEVNTVVRIAVENENDGKLNAYSRKFNSHPATICYYVHRRWRKDKDDIQDAGEERFEFLYF